MLGGSEVYVGVGQIREKAHVCHFSDLHPSDLCLCPCLWPDCSVFSAIYQISHKKEASPGPTLLHTLGANERCTIGRTMKPLTTSSRVARVIKRGLPHKKYITTSAAVSTPRPILPVSRRMVNALAHFPGEKSFCTEARALLANFTDNSQKLGRTFLCCSGVSGD